MFEIMFYRIKFRGNCPKSVTDMILDLLCKGKLIAEIIIGLRRTKHRMFYQTVL